MIKNFIKGVTDISSRELGKEIALAMITGAASYLAYQWLKKQQDRQP